MDKSLGNEHESSHTSELLWEVFAQEAGGEPHEHYGSVRASDAELALQNARDVYARRGELVSLWVVPSSAIVASTPGDCGPFFDPANDKPYRHPQFYTVPKGVKPTASASGSNAEQSK